MSIRLTCTGSLALVLTQVVVLVSSAASVEEGLTAARVLVEEPAGHGCSAGSHLRLRPTLL